MFKTLVSCFLCYLIATEEILCTKPPPNVQWYKGSSRKAKILNKGKPGIQQPRVRLNNGAVIHGLTNKTVDQNKAYCSFRGIPYAEPPVGDLRFKNPVPLTGNFSGKVLYAYHDGSPCIQIGLHPSGSEDCLYLNIYTPRCPGSHSTGLLPVMVWIYGGSFINGANRYQNYGPDFLLDEEDVVIVTINYRLGVYGFLSTEDDASLGNYGIKDQIQALVWIRENIEAFGGNPKQVTIFGESAGAASVSYLSQATLAAGLFRGAIMESGTSFCLWTLTRNPRASAVAIAKTLHIDTSTSQSLVEGLRKVNATQLNTAQTLMWIIQAVVHGLLNGLPFGPSIEPDHPHAVITNDSYTQISEGFVARVPFIVGLNSMEGNVDPDLIDLFRLIFLLYDVKPTALVPNSLNIKNNTTTRKAYAVIKQKYFGTKFIVFSSTQTLVKFVTDDQFNRPIVEYVKQLSKVSHVYFYKFSYEGSVNKAAEGLKGVGHAGELPYLWYAAGRNNTAPLDILTRRRMCKLWTNFAVTGNPTPKQDPLLENVTWPTANGTAGNIRYLNIDTSLTLKENPFKKAILFWHRIFDKYGVPPYSTY